MSEINSASMVFIRDRTPLPALRSMESEPFFPGWRIVKNLDRQELTQEIEGANWNFFYLAGEIRATVLGRGGVGSLRRAVKRILAKQEDQSFRFNALEVTRIDSKWFLGIPLLRLTAHSRHIQLSIALIPAKDAFRRPFEELPSARASHDREAVANEYAVVIASS